MGIQGSFFSNLNSFFFIGLAALAGVAMGMVMNKIKVPKVAGYVLIGFVLGESILGIFQGARFDFLSVEVLTPLALSFIAFSIGAELQVSSLKKLGKSIILISMFEASGAFILVGISSYFLLPYFMKNGNNYQYISVALILAAVASATAPAATLMVLNEARARGDLTKTLIAVVAIDDAIALILYGFSSAMAKAFLSMQYKGGGASSASASGHFWPHVFKLMVLIPLKDITLAIVIGIAAGAILSLMTPRIPDRTDLLIVTVGLLLGTTGVSLMLGLDELLSCMAMGIVLTNAVPRLSHKVFQMTDTVAPPVYCMFFVLAGAHLRIGLVRTIGLLSICYLVMRISGKVLGAFLGARISHAPMVVQKYLGLGLLSQIGVAVGLAMIIRQDFQKFPIGSEMSAWVINILLFTTIFTEVIGPVCTKYAVVKAGEAGRAEARGMY